MSKSLSLLINMFYSQTGDGEITGVGTRSLVTQDGFERSVIEDDFELILLSVSTIQVLGSQTCKVFFVKSYDKT